MGNNGEGHEGPKNLQKMLVKRSYAVWNILLATEEEAKQLAGIIIMAKAVRLQTEYMATQKITVTVNGVPADITEDWLRAFFAKYGQVRDVSPIINKVGIVITDCLLLDSGMKV